MLSSVLRLSMDFAHVRIDFFVVKGQFVFEEIIFTSVAVFSWFGIFGLDEQMGDWLMLQERGM